ncbi:MAG: hypothetical protein K940chlam3_00729 [Chlamydiae bacterium]|nr:hypothetical protein [Chlamydiota bacterium]
MEFNTTKADLELLRKMSNMSGGGGDMIYSTPRMELRYSGSTVTLSPVGTNQEYAWDLYLKHVSPVDVEGSLDGAKMVRLVEKSISRIDPSYEPIADDLAEIENDPERYLRVARALHKKIKKLFFSLAGRKLVIDGSLFNNKLDNAERHTLKIFENIFDHYVAAEQFDSAMKTIKLMSISYQASKSSVKLAELFLNESRFDEMFIALGQIKFVKQLEESLKNITRKLEECMEAEELYHSIRAMENEKVAELVVSELVAHALETDDFSQAKLIIRNAGGESTSEKAWLFLAEQLMEKRMYDQALEVIPNISNTWKMNDKYEEIIKVFERKGEISKVLTTIPYIDSSWKRNDQYEKLVKMYLGSRNIDEALKMISLIESSWKRNDHYLSVIKKLVRKGDKVKANNVALLIESSYKQKDAYKMIATGRI